MHWPFGHYEMFLFIFGCILYLKSVLSDMSIAIPTLFGLLFEWYIPFPSFYFQSFFHGVRRKRKESITPKPMTHYLSDSFLSTSVIEVGKWMIPGLSWLLFGKLRKRRLSVFYSSTYLGLEGNCGTARKVSFNILFTNIKKTIERTSTYRITIILFI